MTARAGGTAAGSSAAAKSDFHHRVEGCEQIAPSTQCRMPNRCCGSNRSGSDIPDCFHLGKALHQCQMALPQGEIPVSCGCGVRYRGSLRRRRCQEARALWHASPIFQPGVCVFHDCSSIVQRCGGTLLTVSTDPKFAANRTCQCRHHGRWYLSVITPPP